MDIGIESYVPALEIGMMKRASLRVVRAFSLLIAILPTLALYRATVDPAYEWGLAVISGSGRGDDYVWLLLFTVLAWISFAGANWYKRAWYYPLPLIVLGIVTAAFTYTYFSQDNLTFQGDAYRIKFELGLVSVLVAWIVFATCVYWVIADWRAPEVVSLRWSKVDALLLSTCAILIPLILYLFSLGPEGVHTDTDRIAVILTVLQGLMFAFVNDRTTVRTTASSGDLT